MSYARQGLTVIEISDKEKKKKTLNILIMKKTGYQNVWFNGQHFYYNRYEQLQDIAEADFTKLAESAESRDKRLIVIRRK